MKRKVAEFILSLGGKVRYSGNSKTMYVLEYENDYSILDAVINEFGYGLPFRLSSKYANPKAIVF